MNDSIPELEARLERARRAEEKANKECSSCDGKGWFLDTTYNRTGAWVGCDDCYKTGLPKRDVQELFDVAFKKFQRSKPDD